MLCHLFCCCDTFGFGERDVVDDVLLDCVLHECQCAQPVPDALAVAGSAKLPECADTHGDCPRGGSSRPHGAEGKQSREEEHGLGRFEVAPSVVRVHVDGKEALDARVDVRTLEKGEACLHKPLRGIRVMLLVIGDAEDRL